SMMIPPTPDMLIPSTPAIAEKYQDESFVSDKKNDSTISILEETCGELETKENDESLNENLADISTQSDLTQDLPELDPTQEILCDIKTPNMSSPKEVIDISAENESDDDDWKLKFSETQETQEFVCTKQVEKCEEPEEVILVKADQDDEEVTLKKDSEDV
ncbi:uncharacterized protein LOC118194538, partial [Stegodyphus dumicola]|uniref:uncharacterized protein LOC118194538 n=1 Tax=Stegodyphus dumicola TaxID=202533 RepID=UPI0015A855B4